jgi:hypothetical protein
MMDPILISLAAAGIQEGISLIQQYANGTPGADLALQQWADAAANYRAGRAAFEAAASGDPKP